MEDSILISTKKNLSVAADVTVFDLDILTHINASFSVLGQVGIGPSGFSIEDDASKWEDLNLPAEQLGLVKTYMFLSVKMLFDPPNTSFQIQAIEDRLQEYIVRLSYMRENLVTENDDVVVGGESAEGTVTTPALVWIMDHNLGFNPAGFRFTTLDGLNELEPEGITYVNVNRTLATWPTPTAGNWNVS